MDKIPQNPLFNPGSAISLLDMIQFCTTSLFCVEMLKLWERVLIQEHTGDDKVTEGEEEMIKEQLTNLDVLCSTLQLTNTIRTLTGEIKFRFYREPSRKEVSRQLETLLKAVEMEIASKKFAFVPTDKHNLFEQDALFEKYVNEKLPDSAKDIKSAGTCLAIGLPDAAIFHLCRASEWGLRALAKKLKVKCKKPVDLNEWGVVLKAIDSKLAVVQQKARSPKKKVELELFTNLSSDCRAIKDTWRDCIMHARGSFLESEAITTFERVKDFLQRVAKNT